MVTLPDSPAHAFLAGTRKVLSSCDEISDAAKSVVPRRLLRLVSGLRSFVCNRSTRTQDCDWRPGCRGGGPPDGERKNRCRPDFTGTGADRRTWSSRVTARRPRRWRIIDAKYVLTGADS